MHGLLRQKQALYATGHIPAFQTLEHNARVSLAVQDIQNSQFSRDIYCLKRGTQHKKNTFCLCYECQWAMYSVCIVEIICIMFL